MIAFHCASCGKRYDVADDLAGRQGRCQACGATMTIPARAPEPGEVVERPVGPSGNLAAPPPRPGQPAGAVGTSGLGVAGFVVGVVALLGSWVPFLGLLTLPLILIGGILSIVALVMARRSGQVGSGWPLGGMVVNAVALTLAVTVNALLFSAIGQEIQKDQADAEARLEAETKAKVKAENAAEHAVEAKARADAAARDAHAKENPEPRPDAGVEKP